MHGQYEYEYGYEQKQGRVTELKEVNTSSDAKYQQYVNENTRMNYRSDIQVYSKIMNGRYLAKDSCKNS